MKNNACKLTPITVGNGVCIWDVLSTTQKTTTIIHGIRN